jgi:hypothetical protein
MDALQVKQMLAGRLPALEDKNKQTVAVHYKRKKYL